LIKGGKGGANTNKTGLLFERETSLETALVDAGFQVVAGEILQDSKKLGLLMEKTKLYKFLEGNDVDWKKIVSTRLLPDEAVFSYSSNSLTVVEKKWQEVSGSVDEKLQTSGFKLRQYRNLFEPLGANVKYIYLLNDWFAHPRYRDVLEYIRESGADYHFKSLPLDLLDL